MKKIILTITLFVFTIYSYSQYSFNGNVISMYAKNGYSIYQNVDVLVEDYEAIKKTKMFQLWIEERASDKEYLERNKDNSVAYLLLSDMFTMGIECLSFKVDNPTTIEYDSHEGILFVSTSDGVSDIVLCVYIKYKDYYDKTRYEKVFFYIYMDEDALTFNCLTKE